MKHIKDFYRIQMSNKEKRECSVYHNSDGTYTADVKDMRGNLIAGWSDVSNEINAIAILTNYCLTN